MIKLGYFEIQEESDLAGVRWWIQVFPYRVPHFEVFKYIGQDRLRETLFFESRAHKGIIAKRWAELHAGDFKPFLMDMARIQARVDAMNGN